MRKALFQSKVLRLMASLALLASLMSVNTACFMFFHQPKVPDKFNK